MGHYHIYIIYFRNCISNVIFAKKGKKSTFDPTMAVPGWDGKVNDITCFNCDRDGHFANQCPEPDCRKKKVTLAQFSLTQIDIEIIDPNWILLDTCTTITVICNPTLVNNITSVDNYNGMTIVTNGGSQFLIRKQILKSFQCKYISKKTPLSTSFPSLMLWICKDYYGFRGWACH